jgi:hypothetical protein
MLAKKLLLGMMIMFIAVSFVWAQSETVYINPGTIGFIQYMDKSDSVKSYSTASDMIGRLDNDDYEIRFTGGENILNEFRTIIVH